MSRPSIGYSQHHGGGIGLFSIPKEALSPGGFGFDGYAPILRSVIIR